VAQQRARFARAGWPLRLIFYGFPLWWVLGLTDLIYLFAGVAMAVALARRPRLVAPRGFGIWLLFLVWVVAGTAVLFADAPGAQIGGGPSRLIVFSYRMVWYATLTTALLYIGNLDEDELPVNEIVRMLAFMFVVTVFGGVIGVAMPHLEFRSAIEYVLPHSVDKNQFIMEMVHPQAAEIQSFLGYSEARPTAPYFYTNDWGANFSMFLPFFALAYSLRTRRRRRWPTAVVLALALIPAVYSLNRGLWLALGASGCYLAVRLAARGRMWAVNGLVVALLVGGLLVAVTPLHSVIGQRLQEGHSNGRRTALSSLTFNSSLHGSPIVGFGTTRKVQGSFSSIAGGDTSDCSSCGVPPLGTQGYLWLVIFSQGLLGAALFLSFFTRRFFASWRSTSPYALAGCIVLVCMIVELPVYDLLGPPMFTVMIALALMWRTEAGRVPQLEPVRRGALPVPVDTGRGVPRTRYAR
jgi:hypothetical protein